MTTILLHDYNDAMQIEGRRARTIMYLSAGRGRRIAAWRLGGDWFARYQIQIAGTWGGIGSATNGDTMPEAVERLQGKR